MAFGLFLATATAGNFGNMEPAKIRNLMKRTYCEEMQGQRVYTMEQLETDCVEKVQFFGKDVSKKIRRTPFLRLSRVSNN